MHGTKCYSNSVSDLHVKTSGKSLIVVLRRNVTRHPNFRQLYCPCSATEYRVPTCEDELKLLEFTSHELTGAVGLHVRNLFEVLTVIAH